METRIVITLTSDERMALVQLAQEKLRNPRDQLRIILRQALLAHGLLSSQQDHKSFEEITSNPINADDMQD